MLPSLVVSSYSTQLTQKLSVDDTICILEPLIIVLNFLKKDCQLSKNLEDRGFKIVIYKDSFTTTPLGVSDGTRNLRADLFDFETLRCARL